MLQSCFVENLRVTGKFDPRRTNGLVPSSWTVTWEGPGLVLGVFPPHPGAFGTIARHQHRVFTGFPDFPSVNTKPSPGRLAIVCPRIYGSDKGSCPRLGGVGGAGVAMSEITQYFLLLYSPYLNIQNRLRVASSGSFHDATYFLNDFFCVFLLFLLI